MVGAAAGRVLDGQTQSAVEDTAVHTEAVGAHRMKPVGAHRTEDVAARNHRSSEEAEGNQAELGHKPVAEGLRSSQQMVLVDMHCHRPGAEHWVGCQGMHHS